MAAGDLAARLRGVLDASARRSAADRIAAVRQFATSLGGQGLADLARADPGLVGNCNGIPFATRIAANRHRMTADRDTLNRADRLDRAGTQRLAVLNDLLRPVTTRRSRDRSTGAIRETPVHRQVVAYAGGSPGRLVEARGDLATASKVAVTVPGMRNKLNRAGLLTKEADRIRGGIEPEQPVASLDTPLRLRHLIQLTGRYPTRCARACLTTYGIVVCRVTGSVTPPAPVLAVHAIVQVTAMVTMYCPAGSAVDTVV